MRHCCFGMCTCELVSERYRFVWRCGLFDWSTYIPPCVRWHGGRCLQWLVPEYVAGFRLVQVHLSEVLYHQRASASVITTSKGMVIWKSDLTDKMKRSFFQAAVVSILLYGCTTWTLTKRMEKKLDGNYTRILRTILKKSWRQHPTKQQLYGHLPPVTKTIKIRRTRHTGHCWRSRDELVSDVLLWTP